MNYTVKGNGEICLPIGQWERIKGVPRGLEGLPPVTGVALLTLCKAHRHGADNSQNPKVRYDARGNLSRVALNLSLRGAPMVLKTVPISW